MTGVNLLATDDTYGDGLSAVAEHTLPTAGIPSATRRAIIIEKANGDSDEIIALRYDCSVSSVKKVWREWVAASVDVRRLGDENPEIFKTKIRRKAVHAIENGLDCDRDPYRQGSLGVAVMKGIGEFKETNDVNIKAAVLVGSVPAEWKERYIGSGSTDTGRSEQRTIEVTNRNEGKGGQ